jgi:hypothetical protein
VNLLSSSPENAYCIYDEELQQISFYNKLNNEKVKQYPAIKIDAYHRLVFSMITGALQGRYSLIFADEISSCENQIYNKIIGIKKYSKDENLLVKIKSNGYNINSPFMAALMLSPNSKKWNIPFDCENIPKNNLIYLGIVPENYKKSDASITANSGVVSYLNVPIGDEEGLFGCKISEFMNSSNDIDISKDVLHLIKNNTLPSSSKLFLKIARGEPYNSGKPLWLVSLREISGKKRIQIYTQEDFLSSIDCSRRLLVNTLTSMSDMPTFATIETHPYKSIRNSGIIVDVENLINFKQFSYNILDGTLS